MSAVITLSSASPGWPNNSTGIAGPITNNASSGASMSVGRAKVATPRRRFEIAHAATSIATTAAAAARFSAAVQFRRSSALNPSRRYATTSNGSARVQASRIEPSVFRSTKWGSPRSTNQRSMFPRTTSMSTLSDPEGVLSSTTAMYARVARHLTDRSTSGSEPADQIGSADGTNSGHRRDRRRRA